MRNTWRPCMRGVLLDDHEIRKGRTFVLPREEPKRPWGGTSVALARGAPGDERALHVFAERCDRRRVAENLHVAGHIRFSLIDDHERLLHGGKLVEVRHRHVDVLREPPSQIRIDPDAHVVAVAQLQLTDLVDLVGRQLADSRAGWRGSRRRIRFQRCDGHRRDGAWRRCRPGRGDRRNRRRRGLPRP